MRMQNLDLIFIYFETFLIITASKGVFVLTSLKLYPVSPIIDRIMLIN